MYLFKKLLAMWLVLKNWQIILQFLRILFGKLHSKKEKKYFQLIKFYNKNLNNIELTYLKYPVIWDSHNAEHTLYLK